MLPLIIPPIIVWLALAVAPAQARIPASVLPITLTVVPHVCSEPCEVHARISIDPHPDNRWWIVQIDGPMFMGSEHPLEGMSSPRTQREVEFKGLSSGEYQVTAVLYRAHRKSEVARQVRTVLVN